MARLSFEDWKKQKETPTGVPEQAMETPADTVPEKRPRLTFEEWQASKQQAPTVAPETVEATQAAPQPQAEPTQTDPSKLQIGGQGFYGLSAGIMATQAAAAGEGMTPEGREKTKEFVREEGLPIVGGTLAAAALPVTATAGVAGWALTAVVAGGGASVGEGIEQTMKKQGLIDSPQGEKPETWGDVGKAMVTQGAEDAAWTAGADALTRMVPPLLRLPFTVGTRAIDDNQHMVKVLAEKGGPILASDVSESLVLNYANSAATYSFTKAGKIMKEQRELQEQVLGEAAQEPLTELVRKAGGDVTDEYIDATLKALPDEIVGSQLTSVIKDGERYAKEVAGARYDAMNDAAAEVGTKTIKNVQMEATGMQYADGQPIMRQTVTEQEVPIYTVDIAEARKVLEADIEQMAMDLKPEAAHDYSQYARSQLRLFSLTDEISLSGAVRQIKSMSQDARALARSTDEGAATKRMWLLKSIDQLQNAMDITAAQMAEAGITVGGVPITTFKRDTDALWRGANETYGNKYVQKVMDQADSKEGAAGSLVQSFMQNRESAEAIITALEASEKAGIQRGKFGVMEDVSKTRTAISAKVYENMLERVLVTDDIKGAMLMLNRPESRKTLLTLLGDENLTLLDTSIRSLVEAKRKGLNVGAFTQFARESAALMEGVPTTSDTFKKMVSTLSFPRLLSKGLRDENVVKLLQGANVESNLNRKVFIYNQILSDAIPAAWEDWNTMSPEEQEKAVYRAKLAQM